jgi:hypothetical protein
MTQYLVAIHHPDDHDLSVAEDEAMSRDIDALNDEMKAAGVRVFVAACSRQAARRRCVRSLIGRAPNIRIRLQPGYGSDYGCPA